MSIETPQSSADDEGKNVLLNTEAEKQKGQAQGEGSPNKDKIEKSEQTPEEMRVELETLQNASITDVLKIKRAKELEKKIKALENPLEEKDLPIVWNSTFTTGAEGFREKVLKQQEEDKNNNKGYIDWKQEEKVKTAKDIKSVRSNIDSFKSGLSSELDKEKTVKSKAEKGGNENTGAGKPAEKEFDWGSREISASRKVAEKLTGEVEEQYARLIKGGEDEKAVQAKIMPLEGRRLTALGSAGLTRVMGKQKALIQEGAGPAEYKGVGKEAVDAARILRDGCEIMINLELLGYQRAAAYRMAEREGSNYYSIFNKNYRNKNKIQESEPREPDSGKKKYEMSGYGKDILWRTAEEDENKKFYKQLALNKLLELTGREGYYNEIINYTNVEYTLSKRTSKGVEFSVSWKNKDGDDKKLDFDVNFAVDGEKGGRPGYFARSAFRRKSYPVEVTTTETTKKKEEEAPKPVENNANPEQEEELKFEDIEGVLTEDNTVYKYLPNGKTKRIEEENTSEEQELLIYIPDFETIKKNKAANELSDPMYKDEAAYEKALSDYAQVEGDRIYPVDQNNKRINTNEEAQKTQNANQRMYLIMMDTDGKRKKVQVFLVPKEGYYAFDQRRYKDEEGKDATEKHFGGKVIEVLKNGAEVEPNKEAMEKKYPKAFKLLEDREATVGLQLEEFNELMKKARIGLEKDDTTAMKELIGLLMETQKKNYADKRGKDEEIFRQIKELWIIVGELSGMTLDEDMLKNLIEKTCSARDAVGESNEEEDVEEGGTGESLRMLNLLDVKEGDLVFVTRKDGSQYALVKNGFKLYQMESENAGYGEKVETRSDVGISVGHKGIAKIRFFRNKYPYDTVEQEASEDYEEERRKYPKAFELLEEFEGRGHMMTDESRQQIQAAKDGLRKGDMQPMEKIVDSMIETYKQEYEDEALPDSYLFKKTEKLWIIKAELNGSKIGEDELNDLRDKTFAKREKEDAGKPETGNGQDREGEANQRGYTILDKNRKGTTRVVGTPDNSDEGVWGKKNEQLIKQYPSLKDFRKSIYKASSGGRYCLIPDKFFKLLDDRELKYIKNYLDGRNGVLEFKRDRTCFGDSNIERKYINYITVEEWGNSGMSKSDLTAIRGFVGSLLDGKDIGDYKLPLNRDTGENKQEATVVSDTEAEEQKDAAKELESAAKEAVLKTLKQNKYATAFRDVENSSLFSPELLQDQEIQEAAKKIIIDSIIKGNVFQIARAIKSFHVSEDFLKSDEAKVAGEEWIPILIDGDNFEEAAEIKKLLGFPEDYFQSPKIKERIKKKVDQHVSFKGVDEKERIEKIFGIENNTSTKTGL